MEGEFTRPITTEKERIENLNQKYFNETPARVVKRSEYNFWRVIGFMGLISLIIILSLFVYLVYEEKLKDTYSMVINPLWNTTTYNQYEFQIDNNPGDIESNVENFYNITIINNICNKT